MANPLRDRDPEAYRLVTIRTLRGELWMPPTRKIRRLIGGIIARYQEKLEIEIYAYVILSNHLHLLIKSPKSNTDEFMENVNREITRRINWQFRREGSLWGRRYSEQHVLTEDDLVEAFLYINTNMCRHGLVDTPSKWRGLHSAEQVVSERSRRFSFYLYSKKDLLGRPVKETHYLKLSILPQFQELTQKRRKQKMRLLLDSRVRDIREGREKNGQGFLGVRKLLEQEPGDVPKNVSKSTRPSCYTKCKVALKKFLRERKRLRELYAECSIRFRLGDLSVRFPEHTYKPPTHRAPRRKAFTHILENQLQDTLKIFA